MSSQRGVRRSWAIATSVIVLLIYTLYSHFQPSTFPLLEKDWTTAGSQTRPHVHQPHNVHKLEPQNQNAQAPLPSTAPSNVSQSAFDAPQPSEGVSSEASSKCSLMKVSMLFGKHLFPQMVEAQDTHRRHCERWGCKFASLDHDISHRSDGRYSKQVYLLMVLQEELEKPVGERVDWLMWVDADSIVINPAISPCHFLPPEDSLPDTYALVTADGEGLNDGLFYLKVHHFSAAFLKQVIGYPATRPDENLGWFGEQSAMAKVIASVEAKTPQSKSVAFAWVPREWFNLYMTDKGFEGKRGDFIVHFAGLGATRLEHMRHWLEDLKNDQQRWEVPLEQTSYGIGVPGFWKDFAANATKGGLD